VNWRNPRYPNAGSKVYGPRRVYECAARFLTSGRKLMIKLIAFATVALAVTTSAQAAPVAPVHEPDAMITQVAYGCGPFRTRVHGVCVARTTVRQARRHYRRCARWSEGACVRYYHY